jgi:type VI protein secretion system component VasF
MFCVLLEARNMTKELLHALLRLRSLPSADQDDRARIECIAALVRFRDALTAKAALILEIVSVDLGHTI